jgi:adenosine deaminase
MPAMADADLHPADPLLVRLRTLPKVVLHDHLDGSLRPQTLLELLAARGQPAPAPDAAGVEAWMDARAHAGTLEAYLEGFGLTVAAMAAPAALARVALEAAQDAQADGAVLAEFRIAPLLFEPLGVGPDAAVEALLDGLARSGLRCGLIVCAMRHLPPHETLRAADLALRWAGRGVVGFDLAGAEAGHPPSAHAQALARVRTAGLPITLHAGEADAGPRVAEAVRHGARRIGHGVRLADLLDDPAQQARVDEVRAAGVHFEVCPTSNVHTGAAASVAQHPIRALWDAGFALSVQTDNRLISGVSASGEACRLVREAGFTEVDLVRMGLDAAEHSFLPEDARRHARAALQGWARGQGLTGF